MGEVESALGFKGKKNIYVCQKCNGHIVTVDLEHGVTPFMVDCKATPACGGMMQSSMYRVFDQTMRADHEWYKPTDFALATMTPSTRRHVEQGGLLIRKRTA